MAGHFVIIMFAIFLTSDSLAAKEKAYYVTAERPNVTYWNPAYVAFVNATTSRRSRRDPRYYLDGSVSTLVPLDNNVTLDLWFYEFRSNEYRRGFVEMHFRWCDLVLKDFFFGPTLRANGMTCPLPPGVYHVRNCSVPDLPLLRTFPFRKGRMYSRVAHRSVKSLTAYIDIEIKQMTRLMH